MCNAVVPLQSTTDNEADRRMKLPAAFGTIQLRILRGRRGEPNLDPVYDDDDVPYEVIHEGKIKRRHLSHRTTLGPVVKHNSRSYHFDKDDQLSNPLSVPDGHDLSAFACFSG